MKNLFFLFVLCMLFASCYDNFRFGETEFVIEETLEEIPIPSTSKEVPETTDNDLIYFADIVQDAAGKAIPGVEVAIYAAGVRYVDLTNQAGEYLLAVPAADLPQLGFISMSLVKQGYIPYNSCYKAPLKGGEVYGNDVAGLALSPCADCLVLGEKSSDLFHLGDDFYGGPENSQFQKTTDGTEVIIPIQQTVDAEQLTITFQVKGIQPSFIDIKSSNVQFLSGGEVVSQQYIEEDSASDGIFSTYTMTVRSANTITAFRFATGNHGTPGSDFDDWEFTCLYAEAQ